MASIKIILWSIATSLLLLVLIGCSPISGKTPVPMATSLSPTLQATVQGSLIPSLLAEWDMGDVFDMAWSPDSRIFAVNSQPKENESNNVQAFDIKSLNRIWIADSSLSIDLAFSPDGQLLTESDRFIGTLYLRSVEQGNIVRQIKSDNCSGGQVMIFNPNGNTLLVADTNGLSGLNSSHTVDFSLWNIDSGRCKDLLQYGESFELFDINSRGNLLAFGGEGPDDSAVIWDMEKQAQVCRTTKVDFGRFVPSQNTLAVVRGQKIVFVDASSCQELRELNISPTFTTYLAFSPDGQWFAIAKQSIEIIETSTGRKLAQIPLPENAAPSFYDHGGLGGIAVSPDGHYLLLTFSTKANNFSDKVELWKLKP